MTYWSVRLTDFQDTERMINDESKLTLTDIKRDEVRWQLPSRNRSLFKTESVKKKNVAIRAIDERSDQYFLHEWTRITRKYKVSSSETWNQESNHYRVEIRDDPIEFFYSSKLSLASGLHLRTLIRYIDIRRDRRRSVHRSWPFQLYGDVVILIHSHDFIVRFTIIDKYCN